MKMFPKVFVSLVIILLFIAAAGFYKGNFETLRTLVFLAGILLSYIAYRGRKFFWITVFILSAVLFNPVFPFYLESSGAWRFIDALVAFLFGAFLWFYYDYYGKGHRFEDYVASLFLPEIWVIVDKTRDFSRKLKRFVESDGNPDFTFRHIETGRTFAVECKYRSYFWKGGIEWDRRKGERYKIYGEKHNLPVFVMFGVGGSPKKPKELFFVPLEKLNRVPGHITRNELISFRRAVDKQFLTVGEF